MDELSLERCHQLLEDGWIGHLAVLSDGEPYVAPVSYVVVDGQICVKTGQGRRVEAIRASPRVCLETSEVDHDTGHWESVVVWGEATEITDEALAEDVVMALRDKYRPVMGSPLSPGSDDVAMADLDILIAIPIETITGRSSGSFFHISTRPGRM
jgi:nitroimidazol reductase NimA-like FMN-containing flavoprotein (pyridoxamine 5'-phosphate oxidase superfamily)